MKIIPVKDLMDENEDKDDNDDSFVHLTESTNTWINKFYRDVRSSSSGKQITVGALSGWCAGFVFTKFGKTAATAIGGTLLLLHIAHNNGYIKVDWNRLNKDITIAKKQFDKRKSREFSQMMQNVQLFIKENAVLAGGFGAGFLIGMASA